MKKVKKIKSGYYSVNGKTVPDYMINLFQNGGIELPKLPGRDLNPYVLGQTSAGQMDYQAMDTMGGTPEMERRFDPMKLNAWGLGIMGAYLGSTILNNKSEERNYEAYKKRWIRDYNIPSLIQDPNKFSSPMYETLKMGGKYQKGGNAPIYTNDLRDPRLRNYQDSLSLYNFSSLMNKKYDRQQYGHDFISADDGEDRFFAPAYRRLGNPKPVRERTKNLPYSPEDPTMAPITVWQWQKPAQPVIYRRQNMSGRPTTEFPDVTNDISYTPQDPNVTGPSDVMMGETDYNITYPLPGYNQQKSIYFPDAKSWRKGLDMFKKVSSEESVNSGTATGYLEDGGIHIKPENKGKFTAKAKKAGMGVQEFARKVMANKSRYSSSTVKQANFARNASKWKHEIGGMTMNTPQQQAMGYYGYPNASSLTFPGQGERTFVPGPFPLLVQDERGTQIMTNKPVKTYGTVRELPLYKHGGQVRNHAPIVPRSEATIEAERGELIFGAGAPGSVEDQEDRVGVGLFKIGGKLHSQGGTPLKAYPGDFVFSNQTSLAPNEEETELLVGKKIKKLKQRTPAKLANKYADLNKYMTMASDKETDEITKKTAILNVNNFIDRLAEIAYVQEEKKGFPEGVPEFVQASLDGRFNRDALQEQLNQFKYGGSVKKYQNAGTITDDIFLKAKKVRDLKNFPGYEYYGTRGNRTYYANQTQNNSELTKAPSAKTFESDPYKLLKTYGTRKTNPLSNYSYDDLLTNRYLSQDTPELRQYWNQFYSPSNNQDFVYQSQNAIDTYSPRPVNLDLGPRPPIANRPGVTRTPMRPGVPSDPDSPFDTFTEIPNSRFNINTAEAFGLLAAGLPSESRYPPAFRNYEIQNAKAQISSTGRPISEQPYLNTINRQLLGYEQSNNTMGAPGATRSLGAFQASLNAQNQAISQVYNQNIARGDQRAQQLAQLEIQDGIDRITNAERYDTKLETLANNKELEKQNRLRNLTRQINQMQSDRESKTLLNQMSQFYQINPDGSMGMKPTYRIENGKLVPYQRNVADLVRGQAPNTTQFNPAIELARTLEYMGYTRDQITRIMSRTIDDFDRQPRRPGE